LRVSVAYKLKRAGSAAPAASAPAESGTVWEISREGAARIYGARVDETTVTEAVAARLNSFAQTLRLPGYRPGQVPETVLRERYGAQSRADALRALGAEIVERDLPEGSIASACDLVAGAESGALEVRIYATHLPDLPQSDLSQPAIERLTSAETGPAAAEFLRGHLKRQLLDRLDSAYSVPLFPRIVEREFDALWDAAGREGNLPSASEDRKELADQLRAIAERRLRLGLVLTELARRFGITGATGAEVEDQVIDHLLAGASVTERSLSAGELQEMMKAAEATT
jgi:FKBP-type peptidyl-prolyl cis-trans isomerase (trigger factor)